MYQAQEAAPTGPEQETCRFVVIDVRTRTCVSVSCRVCFRTSPDDHSEDVVRICRSRERLHVDAVGCKEVVDGYLKHAMGRYSSMQ